MDTNTMYIEHYVDLHNYISDNIYELDDDVIFTESIGEWFKNTSKIIGDAIKKFIDMILKFFGLKQDKKEEEKLKKDASKQAENIGKEFITPDNKDEIQKIVNETKNDINNISSKSSIESEKSIEELEEEKQKLEKDSTANPDIIKKQKELINEEINLTKNKIKLKKHLNDFFKERSDDMHNSLGYIENIINYLLLETNVVKIFINIYEQLYEYFKFNNEKLKPVFMKCSLFYIDSESEFNPPNQKETLDLLDDWGLTNIYSVFKNTYKKSNLEFFLHKESKILNDIFETFYKDKFKKIFTNENFNKINENLKNICISSHQMTPEIKNKLDKDSNYESLLRIIKILGLRVQELNELKQIHVKKWTITKLNALCKKIHDKLKYTAFDEFK